MRNRVHPRKENDGPRSGHVESNVLVELYNAIKRRLSSQGNERSADREQDHGDIEMQHQRSGTCYRIREAESTSRYRQVVFDLVIHETEREDHHMDCGEDEDEAIHKSACCSLGALTTGTHNRR